MTSNDLVVNLLVGFEERFTKQGHEPVLSVLQPGETGHNVLSCTVCGRTATITIGKHLDWRLDPTRLDMECVGAS